MRRLILESTEFWSTVPGILRVQVSDMTSERPGPRKPGIGFTQCIFQRRRVSGRDTCRQVCGIDIREAGVPTSPHGLGRFLLANDKGNQVFVVASTSQATRRYLPYLPRYLGYENRFALTCQPRVPLACLTPEPLSRYSVGQPKWRWSSGQYRNTGQPAFCIARMSCQSQV